MPYLTLSFWQDRLQASAIHFGISLFIASLAALLVFGVWYPYPYREISGGRELFLILIAVDVVMGPLITLAVFNRTKARRELGRDLAVVGLLQLLALSYGLWVMFVSRPVHLVFEYDRFRVVHAIEVPEVLLPRKLPSVDAMPMMGPTLLALRPFRDANEKMEATVAALQGVPLGARPELWQSYHAARERILQEAGPVSALKLRFADQATAIDMAAAQAGRKADALVYLPMVGRKSFWTALLDPTSADVVAYLPLDSF